MCVPFFHGVSLGNLIGWREENEYVGVSGCRYSRTGERDRDEREGGVSTTEMDFFFGGEFGFCVWFSAVVLFLLFFFFSFFLFLGVFLI